MAHLPKIPLSYNSHTEWSKSDKEREISYDSPYMRNLKINDRDELMYKAETDS